MKRVYEAQMEVNNNFTRECQQHFYPAETATVHYQQINLAMVSGVFWMLIAMTTMSVVLFCGEQVVERRKNVAATGKAEISIEEKRAVAVMKLLFDNIQTFAQTEQEIDEVIMDCQVLLQKWM